MMLVWVLLLATTQVSTSVFVHNISKRQSDTTRCMGCHEGDCHDKFLLFKGHTACIEQSPLATPKELTRDEKNEILNYHNLLRASVSPPAVDMLELHWDKELEMLAKRWAVACNKDKNGIFNNDKVRFIPGRLEVGQNIASGFNTFREAIDSWNKENKTYESHIGYPVETTDEISRVGHYTQIAWAETGLLGCATSVCENTNVYVCNYAPPGNILPFLTPYTLGNTRGEKCANLTANGLCDCSGLVCENAGTFDVTKCTCKCKYPTSVGLSCQMDCSNMDYALCGKIGDFNKDTCDTPGTTYACPNMCHYCPCVAANYFPLSCSISKSVSLNYDPASVEKLVRLIALQLIVWRTLM